MNVCDDAISRENTIADIYDKFMTVEGGLHDKTAIKCIEIIKGEPSVQSTWVRNIHDREICPYCGKERWSK